MTTATLKRENDVKDDLKFEAKTFLGDYAPFAGVRYYVILSQRDLAEGRTKIGPVGWRRNTGLTATDPGITWAA